MSLNDVLNFISSAADTLGNSTHHSKSILFYTDAEKYKLIKEEKIYRMFKRRCVKEYKLVTDPQKKENLRQKICTYLPKREQKQKP